MICERCGGENPREVSFCRSCGHQMARHAETSTTRGSLGAHLPDIVCTRCASPNPANLRYCATCGTALPKKDTPTNPEGGALSRSARPPLSMSFGATAQAAPRLAPAVPQPAADAPSPGRHCPACGGLVVTGAAFCQSCGQDLRAFSVIPRPAPVPAPSPHTAPNARLIVIAQDGTPGREYPITRGQSDIGREQGDILLEGDPYACPRHARILFKNGHFWISDLGSVNSIYARLTAPERLTHGDMILIGLEVFRFEMVGAAEANRPPAYERGTRLFGSPALPRYARLVQRTVEGVSANVYYLSKNQSTIGRETGDLVFTDDPFMSRRHATFTRQQDGGFLLTDLGSSNGTFIAVRDERLLPNGGHVRIGQHLFRLHVEG